MAAVNAKNGVIIMQPTDTYTGVGSHSIHAIIVDNTSGNAAGTLTDSDGNVLFPYATTPGGALTNWYGLRGCVSTSNGLINAVTDGVLYIYTR